MGKRPLLTDLFRDRPALSPAELCGLSKALRWDKEPAGAKVHTLSPASHANGPIGRRHHLAWAAADDNRAAPMLLNRYPPLLPPAPRSLSTVCTNLTNPARPYSHARRAPKDSRCFRVCAERRGGAPARPSQSRGVPPLRLPAAPSRPLSFTASPQPQGKAHLVR